MPIAAGVAVVYALPRSFWGETVQAHFFAFALFVGMNLANSANPVLARILMDLGLLNGGIGTMCMTATIVDDLVNWTLFAIILSDIAPSGSASATSLPMSIIAVTLVFVLILGVGRWLGPRTLRWLRGHVTWPSGFIAVTALVVLVAASITEGLGIHAFLGAFLVGVALGGQGDEHQEATRRNYAFCAQLLRAYLLHFDGHDHELHYELRLAASAGHFGGCPDQQALSECC